MSGDKVIEQPRTVSVGSTDLLGVLSRTGGWRTRAELGTLIEEAKDCFGAAESCWERKDWPEMLRHIGDGLAAARKVKEIVQ